MSITKKLYRTLALCALLLCSTHVMAGPVPQEAISTLQKKFQDAIEKEDLKNLVNCWQEARALMQQHPESKDEIQYCMQIVSNEYKKLHDAQKSNTQMTPQKAMHTFQLLSKEKKATIVMFLNGLLNGFFAGYCAPPSIIFPPALFLTLGGPWYFSVGDGKGFGSVGGNGFFLGMLPGLAFWTIYATRLVKKLAH